MKNVTYILVIAILLVALNGCISSPRKEYYQLYIEDTRQGMELHQPGIKTGKVLMVEPVGIEAIYNDYRIAYRSSPYQINYYPYQYWIKKPGKLIRDAIFDYFSFQGLFSKIIFNFSEGDPDYIMKARVNIIEEFDLQSIWYAHLKMEIEIKDFKSGKTLVFHRFDKRKKMKQKKVVKIPIALSDLLKEELAQVVKQIQSSIKGKVN